VDSGAGVPATVPILRRRARSSSARRSDATPASDLDSEIARAKLGTAELSAPDTMRQGRVAHVRIQVSRAHPDSLPTAEPGLIVARDTIRVTREMKAVLLAPGFKVKEASDSVQVVVPGHGATWEYDVTPLGWGEKELTAVVSQHLVVEGRTHHVDFPRTTLRVTVHVDPMGWAALEYEEHRGDAWKWLTGGGLAAAVTWLVSKGRSLFRRTQPSSPK
jgi:hypothetical protein